MSEVKTINIKGKEYIEVRERVRLVHDQQRAFEVIESEPFIIGDRTLWKVTIMVDEKKYKGNAEVKLNAPKSTPDGQAPYECAETSALGRALAFAGFGSVESIASFDEVARAITRQGNQDEPMPQQRAPRPLPTPANVVANESPATPLPTFKQMFATGKEKGLWADSAGFYKFGSDELKIVIDGGVTLSREQRVQLAQAIDNAQPLAQAS